MTDHYYISDTIPAADVTDEMYLLSEQHDNQRDEVEVVAASRITHIIDRGDKIIVFTKCFSVRSYHPSVLIRVRRPNNGRVSK